MANAGSTEEKKNRALKDMLLSLLDSFWEIDVSDATVWVWKNAEDRGSVSSRLAYHSVFGKYIAGGFPPFDDLLNLSGQEERDIRLQSEQEGGTQRSGHFVLTPVFDSDKSLRIVYVGMRVRQADRLDFIARMSHDIRTPMNSIIGMAALAGHNLDDAPRVADFLHKISASSEELLDLVSDALDPEHMEYKPAGLPESEAAEEGAANNHQSVKAFAREEHYGRRALLVEDNALNAEIIEEILKMTDMQVEHVWDGQEAVNRVKEVPDWYYDIIFMDVQMPVMSGNDAARTIRAMEREYTKQVPILAMSANVFEDDALTSITAGMNEYIVKPIDFNQLKIALDKWLPK